MCTQSRRNEIVCYYCVLVRKPEVRFDAVYYSQKYTSWVNISVLNQIFLLIGMK